MAFASTIADKGVMGDKKYARGTYTNGAEDSGGNIDTGLSVCEILILQPTGTAVIATAPVVNETLPVAGNAITVVTAVGEDGIWLAFGY